MDYQAHHELSPRMWSQGLHAHDYYEIYIHLNGGRLYCVDDTIYELAPNQLLVVPPLHMHGLVCDRDLVDYERCYLYLSSDFLKKCGFGTINFPGLIEQAYRQKHILCDISEKEALQCREHMMYIEKQSAKDSIPSLELYTHILQVLQIVETSMHCTSNPPIPQYDENPMQEILHYINDHYTEDLSLGKVSRQFHISESSLSHRFQQYANKGVYDYILYKRILHSIELLYTPRTFLQISEECGFSDYSNFLRVFKRITGESPRSYRKKHQ